MQERLNEECNVLIRARDAETGEVLHERVGHNVWTSTGREYSALLKTYTADGATPFRNDRIAYVGLGSGTQPEVVDVSAVVDPVGLDLQTWLKGISHTQTTFPDAGSRLAVRYVVRFARTDISPTPDEPVFISECGLFTDGNSATFAQGERDTTLANAALQAPVAYHTFAPIPKTNGIELELIWELRH